MKVNKIFYFGAIFILILVNSIGRVKAEEASYYAYIAANDKITVIDLNTNKEKTYINVAGGWGISVDKTSQHVYVTHHNTSRLSVIEAKEILSITEYDLAEETTEGDTENKQHNLTGIAVYPAHNLLYIVDSGTNKVSILDISYPKYPTKVQDVGVQNRPLGIAVKPDGSRVYVTNQDSDSLSVIYKDDKGIYQANHLPLEEEEGEEKLKGPRGVAVNPAINYIYVANAIENTVYVINENAIEAGTLPKPDVAPCNNDGIVDDICSISVNSPFGIAVNSSGTRVYVTSNNGNGLTLIDAEKNQVIDFIPAGNEPLGVSVDPTDRYVYVTNSGSNSVSIIDTEQNKVVETINNIGSGPTSFGQFIGTAIFSDPGPIACIPNNGDDTISLIDLESNRVLCTIPDQDSEVNNNKPFGAAMSSQNRCYVTNEGTTNNVYEIRTDECAIFEGAVSVGNGPKGVAVGRNSNYAYVANSLDNTVSVLRIDEDIAKEKDILIISDLDNDGDPDNLAHEPFGVAVNPNDKLPYAYVTNFGSNTVAVINTETNELEDKVIEVGEEPRGITVNPSGSLVYVANYGDNTISVINAKSNKVVEVVEDLHLSSPYSLAVNSEGNRLYVTNFNIDGKVSIFNIEEKKPVWEKDISVGNRPVGIALDALERFAYVVNSDDNNAAKIDLGSSKVENNISVGTKPKAFGQFIAPPEQEIKILKPEDEEYIPTGREDYKIIWSSPPMIKYFHIFYRVNSSSRWKRITEEKMSISDYSEEQEDLTQANYNYVSYPWDIPVLKKEEIGGEIRIKGYDYLKKFARRSHRKKFNIVKLLKITSPAKKEKVQSGILYTIKWEELNENIQPLDNWEIKLSYSERGKKDWVEIDTVDYVGNGSYVWNVPLEDKKKNRAFIKIESQVTNTAEGNSTTKISETVSKKFRITPFCALEITSPSKKEIVQSGCAYTIEWKALHENIQHQDNWKIKISYSEQGKRNWIEIDTIDYAVDGSYVWNIPLVDKKKNRAFMKIEVLAANTDEYSSTTTKIISETISKKFKIIP